MPDYQSMYFQLFRRVTHAIQLLQQAQIEGEEHYLEGSNAQIIHFNDQEDDSGKKERPGLEEEDG